QRAVDEVVAVDLDRWEEARQRGARLHRGRDRDVVAPGRAEFDRRATIEVGRHEHQPAPELAKVVRAAGSSEQACEEGVDRAVVEDPRGERAAEALEGFEESRAITARDDLPHGRRDERRQRRGAPQVLAECRAEKDRRVERFLVRLALDEHPAHLERRNAVREPGGDEAARAHADIDVERSEIDPGERVGEGGERPDLVDASERPAAGEGEPELALRAGTAGSRERSDRRARPTASFMHGDRVPELARAVRPRTARGMAVRAPGPGWPPVP